MMDIIVPFSIRKKELGGTVSAEAQKIFEKIKEKPALAIAITAKGLPEGTTLHKVYATTPGGAWRLLFFRSAQGRGRSQRAALPATSDPFSRIASGIVDFN